MKTPLALAALLSAAALAAHAAPQPEKAPRAASVDAAAKPASAVVGAKCPDTVGGYMDSRAPAALVRKCMGKPAVEDHNADGRFVYMYELDAGRTMIGFLFDKDGLLIRPVGYGRE